MKKYLITGCAGFIGSNFVYYMLKKYEDILLVNLDKLTYAGNLENLKGVEGDSRHIFVQGDICDKELVAGLFEKYDFDYVINFAAESHVDRSIANPEIFVQTNVMGTVNLLQRAKEAWPILTFSIEYKASNGNITKTVETTIVNILLRVKIETAVITNVTAVASKK